jgi:hypothetical protein
MSLEIADQIERVHSVFNPDAIVGTHNIYLDHHESPGWRMGRAPGYGGLWVEQVESDSALLDGTGQHEAACLSWDPRSGDRRLPHVRGIQ